jgi:hypothetical protein
MGFILGTSFLRAENPLEADVIVYGGTSGGVTAAVETHKEGKSVILISPDKHLGGLTSGGLGWSDLDNASLVGGLSRDFYHRIWLHYQNPAAWNDGVIPSRIPGQHLEGKDDVDQLMFVFEPKAAEAVFNQLIEENKVPVVNARLDLKGGVLKEGTRITGLRVEDGRVFHGKIFIDATYEGDLMAKAGVSYAIGREPSSQYNESLNGLEVHLAIKNQLLPGIDPYLRKGDPASGLLPGINPTPTEPDGTGDKKIQAYCYRMCLTSEPANMAPIAKPEGYREEDYELLFRAIEAGQKDFFKTDPIPNHKTDSNNTGGISTDYIGMNYDYPDGDYATRERIARAQETWQRGLIWTLQNSPRVPPAIRALYSKWGLPKDEFKDNNNWPPPLYVREARRLVGDYVLTEPILTRSLPAKRPIGLGSYAMDSHNVERIVGTDGMAHNEGDVQKKLAKPYQIDYGVLLPKHAECENLLVPFCISATHIAFGSVRMEPVFMILGQSAASAASIALDDKVAVQDVPYDRLKAKLLIGGQQLEFHIKPLISP